MFKSPLKTVKDQNVASRLESDLHKMPSEDSKLPITNVTQRAKLRGPFRRNRRFCLCNYGRCYRENYQRHILKDGGVDYCRGCHRPGESMRHVITGRPPYSNVRPWNPKEEINCFLNTEADNHRDQLERTVLPPIVLASNEPETVSWCAQELQNMQIKDEGNQPSSNSITSFNGPSQVSTLPADNTEFVSY